MSLVLFRALLLVLLAFVGFAYSPLPGRPLAGLAVGVAAAAAVVALEIRLRAVKGNHIVGVLVGGVLGLTGARLVWSALTGLAIQGESFLHVIIVVFMVYMGIIIGAR